MGSTSRICYKDILPFASMVMIECIIVGGNTLFKSPTSQDINSYVFTTYVFIVGFMFLIPCAIIVLFKQRRLNIPPLKLSIVVKLFVLSLIWYFSQIFGYVGIKYSSPTLSSVMSNLAPAFTFILAFFFRMEKLNLRSHTSQAKVVGTVVSISGALVATLYNGLIMVRDLDSWKLKPDMMLVSIIYMRDEGINLVTKAICSEIFNDLGSGSNVDVCVIEKGKKEYLRNHLTPNPRTYISSRGYTFSKKAEVLLTKITPLKELVDVIEAGGDAMEE